MKIENKSNIEPISIAEHADCMDFMEGFPDKFFDLAIVDIPYGNTCSLSGGNATKDGFKDYWSKITGKGHWNNLPDRSYFDELFRITKNQIMWGANHFTSFLPHSSGWVFWDKGQRNFSFSDGELAFTSFNCKLKVLDLPRAYLQKEFRIHPTQKPVELYKWLLVNYAKKGDKILDTHLGSQSSRIAAWDLGFDFWGCELDKDYFQQGNKRFQDHIKQPNMLNELDIKPMKQVGLFEGGK